MENFISYNPKNKVLHFTYSDSKEQLYKNKKLQPNNWIYRTKKIEYLYNEHGFRERNFSELNWCDSVVIIGCSIVQGEGLAKEDTIADQLSKIIKIPVINLGVAGGGVDLSCWNSTVLHENFPVPKAIVHVWPSVDRYTDRINDRFKPFIPNVKNYQHQLDWTYRSTRYVQTDRALWKNKTFYCELSFYEHTAEILNVDYINLRDYARDLMHPGINSAKSAADHIAENLHQHNVII
jgi:hypothetical protein